jgi:hypothetical protein
MRQGFRTIGAVLLGMLLFVPLHAATVSRQHADAFARKLTQIQQQANAGTPAARRTPVSEDEVNSWFAFTAQPLLPSGVSEPKVTALGQGRVMATAIVDLEEVAKRRASGSSLSPWNLVGGRVPLTVTGILHTRNGVGRVELQRADISGVPVPVTLVQELVSLYSRSDTNPGGVRLDDPFALPSKIREIQVGQGQAIIVQ